MFECNDGPARGESAVERGSDFSVSVEHTLNPYVQMTSFEDPVRGEVILVVSCRRGQTPQHTLISRSDEPGLFVALKPWTNCATSAYAKCELMAGRVSPIAGWRFPGELRRRLIALGLLTRPNERPRPVRYDSPLGARLPRLVPAIADRASEPSRSWLVHPGYFRGSEEQMPTSLRRSVECFPDVYAPAPVWVEDPYSHVAAPIWPRGVGVDVCARLRPATVPEKLDGASLRLLAGLGVLVSPAAWRARQQRLRAVKATGAQRLRLAGYIVLDGLLQPFQTASLRRYYRRLIAEGFLPLLVKSGAKRFVLHEDPIALCYQRQLLRTVRSLVGQAVRPSGASVSAYLGGSALDRHVDGPTSDWNVSIQIDVAHEASDVAPWPLYLDPWPARVPAVGVRLRLGDAVVYSGNRTHHYRHQLPRNQRCTTLTLHYAVEQRASSRAEAMPLSTDRIALGGE